mmetsp:Transcript_6358/g.19766  ORF Transcript_6358/g.19766 Transcript_6358/m.19766 type:complete len:243 (-) Transcript_6358:189-917(-)
MRRWPNGSPGLQTGSSSNCHALAGLSSSASGRSPDVWLAPAQAMAESSFMMPERMPSASTCNSERWSVGTSSSASSVTSAWMPIRNQRSSPVRECLATVRPRRSRRLRKSSPVFLRFGNSDVNGAPVSLAIRRSMSSAGFMSQPWLRKRQFTPRISLLLKPVIVSNSSETAISGKSKPLGFAMVTQNLQDFTAARMACFTKTSLTTTDTILSISEHWRLQWCESIGSDVVEPVFDTNDTSDA